jgi:hypothetical protein
LEDLYHTYRYALGRQQSKLRYGNVSGDVITQSHGAARDTVLLENVQRYGDRVEKIMHRESMGLFQNDLDRFMPMKQKLVSGSMRVLAARTMVDDPSTPFKQVSEALKYFDKQAGGQYDPTSMAKRLKAKYEFTQAEKIEKGMFKGMKGVLGGPGTVGALLAGASLAAGVQWAVRKAELRKMKGEDEVSDGMGHNSLQTIVRRMAMTSFWSPFQAGAAVAGGVFKTIGLMLGGTIAPTREALKETLTAVMSVAKGSAFATKEGVKSMHSGEYVTKSMEKIFKKFSTVLGSLGENISKSTFLGQNMKTDVGGFIGRQAEKIAKLSEVVGTTTLKEEGGRKFLQSIGRKLVTKEGKMTMYSMAALGGLGGSLMLSAAAGKYDPDKVPDQEEAIKRAEVFNPVKTRRNEESVFRRIANLRNATNEGMQFGSTQRQMQRYTKTDFGSGLRNVVRGPKKMLTGLVLNDDVVDFQRVSMEVANRMTYNRVAQGLHGTETTHRILGVAVPTRARVDPTQRVIRGVENLSDLPSKPNVGIIAGSVMDDIHIAEYRQQEAAINSVLLERIEEARAIGDRVLAREATSGAKKAALYTARGKRHTLPDVEEIAKAVREHKGYGGPEKMFELTGISDELKRSSTGISPMHQIGKRIKAHRGISTGGRSRERVDAFSGQYQDVVSDRLTRYPNKEWMSRHFAEKRYRNVGKSEAESVMLTEVNNRAYLARTAPQERMARGTAVRDISAQQPNPVAVNIAEHLKAGPGAQGKFDAIPINTYHDAALYKERAIIREQLFHPNGMPSWPAGGSSYTREGKVHLSGSSRI